MKRPLIILSLFFIVQSVYGRMTLNDCLRYASLHAHDNILNELEVRKASVEKRITASDLMPYLSASTSGNISFGRNIDPETNTYDNKQTLSTGFGLNLSIPVFDGLVRINNLKIMEIAKRRRKSTAEIERDRISFEVIRTFYQVSYCQAMVRQMASQLERDSLDLVATLRGESLGVKSGADVAQLEALVATDRSELVNQEGMLSKAHMALKGAMGMAPDAELPELDWDSREPESGGGYSNPRITEAQLGVRQSEYELKVARGAYSPRISLNGGVSTSYYRLFGNKVSGSPGFGRQWHDNMGEYIGFSITIPLFTGLATFNKVRRARINVEESRVRLEKTLYEVERETAEAMLDVTTSETELEAASRRLEAEQIAYDAVRRRFELGSATAVDLYTSGAKLMAARAGLESTRIRKIISEITLSYYMGTPLLKD